MTPQQREQHRQRLVSMAARLKSTDEAVGGEALRQVGGDASGNLSSVPLHLADVSTETFEQEMSTTLLQNGRELQTEVAAALDRIEQGKFGNCEHCGQAISDGRLQAVPYTRHCIDCAQKAEDEGEVGYQPALL